MNDSEQFQAKGDPVAAPDDLVEAVAELSNKSGHEFRISESPVEGTDMFVVYAVDHPLSAQYTVASGIFGFRVPRQFPNAGPEDSFFIQPHDVKLKQADPARNSTDVHRASSVPDFLKGTELGGSPGLAFSWHLWNTVPWNRNKHTLVDHYGHCVRRFEKPEHD
jgi:hypothetical protein